jgi:hypothetical protein
VETRHGCRFIHRGNQQKGNDIQDEEHLTSIWPSVVKKKLLLVPHELYRYAKRIEIIIVYLAAGMI